MWLIYSFKIYSTKKKIYKKNIIDFKYFNTVFCDISDLNLYYRYYKNNKN